MNGKKKMKEQTTIQISKETRNKIKVLAAKEGISIKDFINKMLKGYKK
jgi:predicted HicB family RNase H-like nuclease